MKTRFICPDGQETEIKNCLVDCRMKNRCLPLSFLRSAGDVRPWNGIPSVTQLLKGTRHAYLEIVNDYAEKPQSSVYAIMGKKTHANLEQYGINPEEGIAHMGISGIPDDVEGDVLIDHKNTGSYKVAKCLGIVVEEVENGNKKPKKIFKRDKNAADFGEWLWQINMYRLMLKSIKVNISKQKLNLMVRDGGTYIAKGRGIEEEAYYIDVPFLPDDVVIDFFSQKRDALIQHLQQKVIPIVCSPEEAWNGNKCKKYCPVVAYCDCPYL